jgi:hypothetical protein
MENLNNFFGVVVYSIADDGCLNGLWTNIANDGKIMNEIAKKSDTKISLDGEYNVTYIEVDKQSYNGILKIDLIKDTENTYYQLNWIFTDKTKFLGKGFKIGKQLIVSYWPA